MRVPVAQEVYLNRSHRTTMNLMAVATAIYATVFDALECELM